MTDAYYWEFVESVGKNASALLHKEVCPVLKSFEPSVTSDFWLPSKNYVIVDLIHALCVVNAYHPKNFNNYSWKKYFLACLIAMGPSSTLRAILTGLPWAFTITSSTIPMLLVAMAFTMVVGRLPTPILGLLRYANNFSTVLSVRDGVLALHSNLRFSAIGCILVGIANGGGGAVWGILIAGWFGTGTFNWEKLNAKLPIWTLVSLVWNIVFWSKCNLAPINLAVVEVALYVLLCLDSLRLGEIHFLPPRSVKSSNPTPSPSKPSQTSNGGKGNKVKQE